MAITNLIQNPRDSSPLNIPGVSASATSGLALFLRITDLLLPQPPRKTCNLTNTIVYLPLLILYLTTVIYGRFIINYSYLIHRFSLMGTSGESDMSIVRCFYTELKLPTSDGIEIVLQFVFSGKSWKNKISIVNTLY